MTKAGLSRLTAEIPEELHRRVKVRAAELRTGVRVLVIEGLELVLSERSKPKKGGRR